MPVLHVATCQFPVSADIEANLRFVKRQMTVAASRGARAAHFPEGALSGYAGTDFASFDGFGWDRLAEALGGGRAAQRDTGPRSALGGPGEPVAADKRSLNLLSPALRPAPTLGGDEGGCRPMS